MGTGCQARAPQEHGGEQASPTGQGSPFLTPGRGAADAALAAQRANEIPALEAEGKVSKPREEVIDSSPWQHLNDFIVTKSVDAFGCMGIFFSVS